MCWTMLKTNSTFNPILVLDFVTLQKKQPSAVVNPTNQCGS